MRENSSYQYGDVVKIINSNSPLYGEQFTIAGKNGSFFILHSSFGEELLCDPQDIVHSLSFRADRELFLAQLLQMQLLAVDLGDKDWFEELGDVYRKYQKTEV